MKASQPQLFDILCDEFCLQTTYMQFVGIFFLFDEKALAEVQRCANAGDTLSQEEMWIYIVNRGRLYLRLGRIDEAEQLLDQALPRIHLRRRNYRMFARKGLEEIEQWRKTKSSHYQLDWRWVNRYHELDAYDAYWWWAQA